MIVVIMPARCMVVDCVMAIQRHAEAGADRCHTLHGYHQDQQDHHKRPKKRSGHLRHSTSVCYSFTLRRRKALVTTETELIAMAAPANIGESSSPNAGYSTPAAMGTPSAL